MRSSQASISQTLYFLPTSEKTANTQQNEFILQETSITSQITNWRTSQMVMDGSSEYMDLRFSISGAPNKLGWNNIAENIRQMTQNNVKRIIVLDLRQESHLYLNDQGILLAKREGVINLGMNRQQVINEEDTWLLSLSQCSNIYVLTTKQFKTNEIENGTYVSRQTLQNEARVVSELGLEYHRLAVMDHGFPSNDDIDAFIELFNELQEDDWIHFHCKGGKGRSSTFTAFYMMLKIADKMPCDDIVNKLASVPPYYNLYNIDTDIESKTQIEDRKIRLQILQNFYLYAQTRLKGYTDTWSNWLNENIIKHSSNIVHRSVSDEENPQKSITLKR